MRRCIFVLVCLWSVVSVGHAQYNGLTVPDPDDREHTEFTLQRPKVIHKIVQVGTGAVATVALTELMKAAVSERRPDGSDKNSFPSRHTSWAWAGATVLARELYWHSPWWVIGAHAVADGVAFQRVMSKRHWPGDVVAGAVLGMGSMQLGYWVGDLLFPQFRRQLPEATNDQAPYLSLSTEICIPLNQPDGLLHWRSGLGSHLTLSLPTSDHTAMQVSAVLLSMPGVVKGTFDGLSNNLGVTIGGQYRHEISARWAGEVSAEAGVLKNFETFDGYLNPWTFTGGIDVATSYRITRSLMVGLQVGYHVLTLESANQQLTIGFQTRAVF